MAVPRWQLNRIPSGAFTSYHYAHVSKLLKRATVRVASNKEREEELYGFSLTEGQHVHMVYVSKSHWRLGIGKALLPGLTVSQAIARLWPNTSYGSSTEWMRPRLEEMSYIPYWMETKDG